jgi:hypothetical protein
MDFEEPVLPQEREKPSALDMLLKSENMLIEIMSWLPGNAIVHRVAVANKRLRHVNMQIGPLIQDRIVVLKVGKQEKQQKSFVFLAKKEEDEAISTKQGVNFSAYMTLMKFANHVKVVCRDDNFENCLVVFDLIRAMNSSI